MAKHSHRKIVVLGSLVGVLTLTSALLLALAPPPLSSQTAYNTLWATGTEAGLIDVIFQTHVPGTAGRWKYIYIHQSGTLDGSAAGRGDHFVIGNGYGSQDGEIQMSQRWNNQTSAAAPSGARSIDPACISICLIGNFDSTAPTANQSRRLAELVNALQGQLGIGGDKVYLLDSSTGAAGVGRNFPLASLRQQILP